MTDIYEISVGKVYPGWKIGQPEGVIFDFTNSGAVTLLCYNNPRRNEIENIEKGDIKAGIAVVNGITFILMKMGSLPWVDSPYHSALSKPFNINPIEQDDVLTGYAWSIILLDNLTGIVKDIRFVAMPHNMSVKLYTIIQAQKDFASQGKTFDRKGYDRKIDSVYRAYPTEALLRFAEIEKV